MFERVTITVPKDLRRRMRSCRESVNWSAVASRAFEVELAAIATRKEKQTMDDLVQRMRASKLATADKDYATGYDRGGAYVKEVADWAFCSRLKQVVGTWSDVDWGRLEQEAADVGSAVFEVLLARVDRERFGTKQASRDFVVAHVGDYVPGAPTFLRGWCDGVLRIFLDVEARAGRDRANPVARRSYTV